MKVYYIQMNMIFLHGSVCKFELDPSFTGYLTADTLKGVEAINKIGYFTTINPYNKTNSSYRLSYQLTLDNPNYYFVRTDILPDLDFEAGETTEEICGIYKNSLSTSYKDYYKAAVGSFVLGCKENTGFGKFIGVNAGFWETNRKYHR